MRTRIASLHANPVVMSNERALLNLSLFYWCTDQWAEASITAEKALGVAEARGGTSKELAASIRSVVGWLHWSGPEKNREVALECFEKSGSDLLVG